MRNEKGLSLVALAITIVAILTLAGVATYFVLGEDGILEQATTDEVEYNKNEVLEELNFVITQKYLDAYHKGTSGGSDNIAQYYNTEKVIMFLKGYTGGETGDDYSVQDTKVLIEDLVEATDMYYINISEFKIDTTSYGTGKNEKDSKDFFFIKKEGEEQYKVYYRNSEGTDEEIGELEFQPEI